MEKPARSNLGKIIRSLREKNGWRIADVSEKTGIAMSTISKVENGQMSLTYDKLMQLADGLSLHISELFAEAPAKNAANVVTGRRSIGRKGDGLSMNAGPYEYLSLAPDLAPKTMIPILGSTHARSIDEFDELISHEGEEFVLVLEGEIELYTQYYSPVTLTVGDYAYFDSSMGHAYIAKSETPPRFIVVCSGPEQDDSGAQASIANRNSDDKRDGLNELIDEALEKARVGNSRLVVSKV